MWNAYNVVLEIKRKEPLGRPGIRWKDNNKSLDLML